MVTMKAKQMVSKFDLDVLKQPLTFNIIITIIPVGRVMYIYTALTGVDRWIGNVYLRGRDVVAELGSARNSWRARRVDGLKPERLSRTPSTRN